MPHPLAKWYSGFPGLHTSWTLRFSWPDVLLCGYTGFPGPVSQYASFPGSVPFHRRLQIFLALSQVTIWTSGFRSLICPIWVLRPCSPPGFPGPIRNHSERLLGFPGLTTHQQQNGIRICLFWIQTNKNSDINHYFESLQNNFHPFPQVGNLVG